MTFAVKFSLFLGFFLLGSASFEVNSQAAYAQPIPDSSLGSEGSIVSPETLINNIPSNLIDGGALRGINLFHSFQDFSVEQGRGIYFSNPAGVENIFGRVVGANASNIFGTLGVLGEANLFLMNPNGIIFGPSSSLDLRGSFVGTTAGSVRFADESIFSAREPQDASSLTISVPIGLQYSVHSGQIRNNGARLTVDQGRTLALVGAAISLERGLIESSGGRIELGAVSGDALVNLGHQNNAITLDYAGIEPSAFGNISLSQGALVRVSEPRGTLAIQANQLSIRDGSQVSTTTFGQGDAGDLFVRAVESVTIEGQDPGGFPSGLFARVNSDASGEGGNIQIDTGRLTLRNGGVVTTSTSGIGNAGEITINASDRVEILGGQTLQAFIVQINNISYIFIFRNSVASTVTSRVDEGATGDAGSIRLTTGSLLVQDSAFISTSSFGGGNAGNIFLEVQGDSSLNRGSLFSQATQPGFNAGTIDFSSGSLFLDQGQIFAESKTSFGGNINLNISDRLFLRNGSIISATAGSGQSAGTGGNIAIRTNFLIANPRENSDITAIGGQQGGTIFVEALEIFGIRPTDRLTPFSDFSVSTLSRFGTSGNITLDTPPELNPARDLAELPTNTVNVSDLIAQGCGSIYRSQTGGTFNITYENLDITDPGYLPVDSARAGRNFSQETATEELRMAEKPTVLEDGSVRLGTSQMPGDFVERGRCSER